MYNFLFAHNYILSYILSPTMENNLHEFMNRPFQFSDSYPQLQNGGTHSLQLVFSAHAADVNPLLRIRDDTRLSVSHGNHNKSPNTPGSWAFCCLCSLLTALYCYCLCFFSLRVHSCLYSLSISPSLFFSASRQLTVFSCLWSSGQHCQRSSSVLQLSHRLQSLPCVSHLSPTAAVRVLPPSLSSLVDTAGLHSLRAPNLNCCVHTACPGHGKTPPQGGTSLSLISG